MIRVVRVGSHAVVVGGGPVVVWSIRQIDSDESMSVATPLCPPRRFGRMHTSGDRFGVTSNDGGEPRDADGGAINGVPWNVEGGGSWGGYVGG